MPMDFGWYIARQAGSHVHLKHPDRPVRVTVPVHTGEILKPKTWRASSIRPASSFVEFAKML